MKDSPFTKKQAKMMITCFCGALMLAVPVSWAIVINRFLGIGIILFALVMLYGEFGNEKSVGIKEKLVSFVLVAAFIAAGVILFINNGAGGAAICAIGSLIMIVWGISDIIGAKEMIKVYSAVIFTLTGTIALFFPSRTEASIVHICGIFICYYSLSSFLKDKFG